MLRTGSVGGAPETRTALRCRRRRGRPRCSRCTRPPGPSSASRRGSAARASSRRAESRSSRISTSATGSPGRSDGRPPRRRPSPVRFPSRRAPSDRRSMMSRMATTSVTSKSGGGAGPGPRPTTPRPSTPCEPRSRGGTSTRSTWCSILSGGLGHPRALAACLAPLTQPNDAPLGDSDWRVFEGNGWAIVSASPELLLSGAGGASAPADQGDPARRRARSSRRRTQRST